jgi:hypothetical protein
LYFSSTGCLVGLLLLVSHRSALAVERMNGEPVASLRGWGLFLFHDHIIPQAGAAVNGLSVKRMSRGSKHSNRASFDSGVKLAVHREDLKEWAITSEVGALVFGDNHTFIGGEKYARRWPVHIKTNIITDFHLSYPMHNK